MADPNPWLPPDDLTEALEGKHDDELVDLLRLMRDTSRAWSTVAAVVESEIANRNPAGQHATSDGAAFKVRKGATKTTWDTDRLWSALVARACDERLLDEQTGEYEREADAVGRVLRSCLGKNPGWTATGVRDAGLDPDDYRTTEGYRSTVQLD